MFISAFCELNTKYEFFFYYYFYRQGDMYNTGVISGSQMGSQLLQNTEIIKQRITLENLKKIRICLIFI